MKWIVEHIQQGECHYVQKYMDNVIEKQRKEEENKIKILAYKFNMMKEKENNRCQMNPWREKSCPKSSPSMEAFRNYLKSPYASCGGNQVSTHNLLNENRTSDSNDNNLRTPSPATTESSLNEDYEYEKDYDDDEIFSE